MTELCNLARKYGTDKVIHGYTLYYNELFQKKKDENLNFLELGIFRGSSILMWHDYFVNSTIYCIDNCLPEKCSGKTICPSTSIDKLNKYSNRIKAYLCEQENNDFINILFNIITCDYIVDDASDFQKETLQSLVIFFKKLKSGGIYIIEDICNLWGFQTGSWWGQKNGKKDTNAGSNKWLEDYKMTGKLKDEELFNDSIHYVLRNFINTQNFYSEYLTDEENKYLTDNILKIELIIAPEQRSKEIHDLGIPTYPGTKNTKLKNGAIGIIYKK